MGGDGAADDEVVRAVAHGIGGSLDTGGGVVAFFGPSGADTRSDDDQRGTEGGAHGRDSSPGSRQGSGPTLFDRGGKERHHLGGGWAMKIRCGRLRR